MGPKNRNKNDEVVEENQDSVSVDIEVKIAKT